MSSNNKTAIKNKEPFFHITKRKHMEWYQSWAVRILAIILALVICAVITSITTGLDPVSVYGTMFKGAFGTQRKIWILGKEVAILLCVSLALTPAFRMKFWNLGGEGQVLIGALVTATCMIYLKSLPQPLLIVVMLVTSVAAGAVWAGIPAFFKASYILLFTSHISLSVAKQV